MQLKDRLAHHSHAGFQYSEHACALAYGLHETIGNVHTILVATSAGLLTYAVLGLSVRLIIFIQIRREHRHGHV